jgi:hypothetical protein
MLRIFGIGDKMSKFNVMINEYINWLIEKLDFRVNDVIYDIINIAPEIELSELVVNFKESLCRRSETTKTSLRYPYIRQEFNLNTFLSDYRLYTAFIFKMKMKEELHKEGRQYFDRKKFLDAGKLYKNLSREELSIYRNDWDSWDGCKKIKYQLVSEFMKKHYGLQHTPKDIYDIWESSINMIASAEVGGMKLEIIHKYEYGDICRGEYNLITMNFDNLYCACVNFRDEDLRKLVLI